MCDTVCGDASQLIAEVILDHPTLEMFCRIPLRELRCGSSTTTAPITEVNISPGNPKALYVERRENIGERSKQPNPDRYSIIAIIFKITISLHFIGAHGAAVVAKLIPNNE
jgi:hypothetical protein